MKLPGLLLCMLCCFATTIVQAQPVPAVLEIFEDERSVQDGVVSITRLVNFKALTAAKSLSPKAFGLIAKAPGDITFRCTAPYEPCGTLDFFEGQLHEGQLKTEESEAYLTFLLDEEGPHFFVMTIILDEKLLKADPKLLDEIVVYKMIEDQVLPAYRCTWATPVLDAPSGARTVDFLSYHTYYHSLGEQHYQQLELTFTPGLYTRGIAYITEHKFIDDGFVTTNLDSARWFIDNGTLMMHRRGRKAQSVEHGTIQDNEMIDGEILDDTFSHFYLMFEGKRFHSDALTSC